MPLDTKLELLRAKAARALGNHQVAEAMAQVRAIIGPANIPDSEPLAQAALEKLQIGEVPSAEELTALEIVVRLLRPVVFSRRSKLGDLPESPGHNLHPQEYKDLWSSFRPKVEPLLYSIGRVELATGTHVGTGFLVADGLIATNRHVLGVLTLGSEVTGAGHGSHCLQTGGRRDGPSRAQSRTGRGRGDSSQAGYGAPDPEETRPAGSGSRSDSPRRRRSCGDGWLPGGGPRE